MVAQDQRRRRAGFKGLGQLTIGWPAGVEIEADIGLVEMAARLEAEPALLGDVMPARRLRADEDRQGFVRRLGLLQGRRVVVMPDLAMACRVDILQENQRCT